MGNRDARNRNKETTAKLRLPRYAPHAKTVVPIVVVGRVDIRRIEVQVVGVVGIAIGVRTRRPIVPVVSTVVQLTRVHVARWNKEQS